MPIAWEEHWPTSELETEHDRRRRNDVLHTIGNLTLVTRDMNGRLANNCWHDKRRMISESSENSRLMLNQDLRMNEYSGKWDVPVIMRRSQKLYDLALRAWPGPDSNVWQQ